MRLYTLWAIWDDDTPEMVNAVDENTYDQHNGAWTNGWQAACRRYGITDDDLREIVIEVPDEPIVNAFRPVEITATAIDIPDRQNARGGEGESDHDA